MERSELISTEVFSSSEISSDINMISNDENKKIFDTSSSKEITSKIESTNINSDIITNTNSELISTENESSETN